MKSPLFSPPYSPASNSLSLRPLVAIFDGTEAQPCGWVGQVLTGGEENRAAAPASAWSEIAPGGWQQQLNVGAETLWDVEQDMDDEVAALLEPLGAVTEIMIPEEVHGYDVLIQGTGIKSLLAVALARHLGARRAIIEGENDFRLGLADRLGADVAVNRNDGDLNEVLRFTGARNGFHLTFDFEAVTTRKRFAGFTRYGRVLNAKKSPPSREAIGMAARYLSEGLDIAPAITHQFTVHELATARRIAYGGFCGAIAVEMAPLAAVHG